MQQWMERNTISLRSAGGFGAYIQGKPQKDKFRMAPRVRAVQLCRQNHALTSGSYSGPVVLLIFHHIIVSGVRSSCSLHGKKITCQEQHPLATRWLWYGRDCLICEANWWVFFFSGKYKLDDSVIVRVGAQRNGGWQNMCLVPRLKRLQLICALVWVCIALYCVPEPREECANCWAQDTGIAFKTAPSFYLTAWNPANFIGASSKSHFFSEFFREAGTREDFPIQAWEKEKRERWPHAELFLSELWTRTGSLPSAPRAPRVARRAATMPFPR